MTLRRHGRSSDDACRAGFTGFLRSLLSSIPWSERVDGEEILHYEPPSGAAIRIHNSNGRTIVCGEDRDDIEVLAQKVARAESVEGAEELMDDIRVRSAELDGTLDLDVEVSHKWNRRGYANLVVRIPRRLSVEISAENGRIEVEGVRGTVRARSSNGSAVLRDVQGQIHVATSNAKVSCTHTSGRLLARSRDGKIELVDHRGSIDASTSNGLIRASLASVDEPGVRLCTSNGRIVVDLPEQIDADVDVRVDNGTIRNERPLCECQKQTRGRMLGRLGKGGKPIKLRTSNGSVCMR